MTQVDEIEVVLADERHLEDLVLLFDGYRQFYAQEEDLYGARAFLEERLQAADSTIFLALLDDTAVGFVQLYPTFSSVRMRRVWILNDLFVSPDARRTGVATALLRRAYAYARDTGAARLTLQTARDNLSAQATYEADGWVRDDAFLTYTLSL